MSSTLRHDEPGPAHRPPAGSIGRYRVPTPLPAPNGHLPQPPTPSPHLQTLVDQYLADQRRISAVDQFSRWHDQTSHRTPHPTSNTDPQRFYRKLLPVTGASGAAGVSPAVEEGVSPPGIHPGSRPASRSLFNRGLPTNRPARGQQYAFQVDLDACSGCKACVSACHSLNGLEPGESWRSVGLLLDRQNTPVPLSSVAVQHVTTACHHCVDPACLNGCPVLAYEKDADTGIVRHLDDQCIGCSYCTLMCPYEVPRYSSRLGIVRKCDLCHGRLAAGEAPACVQGCPNEAIQVTLVDTATLESTLRRPTVSTTTAPTLVPDAPDSSFTVPTTRYVSASGRAGPLVAADRAHAVPAAAHTPLSVFLVLSQASVGLAAAATIANAFCRFPAPLVLVAALGLQLIALAIATAHLGQPLRAWRAFLGWRRSWFSREVLAFGAYTAALAASAAGNLGLELPETVRTTALVTLPWLGLVGVVTSAMIYVATRRAFWSAGPTFARFLGTVVITGGASLASPGGALFLVLLGLVIKLTAETFPSFRRNADAASETERTRSLLFGVLRPILTARLILAALGAGCFAVEFLAVSVPGTTLALLGTTLLLAGELIERHLFFVAVSPQRMPGAVPP